MAMSYQEFKDHLIDFLWKKGDQVLIDRLDNLVRMGEAKLQRDLRVERRHRSVDLKVTLLSEPLPSDYDAMRQVVDLSGFLGPLKYVSPAELRAERQRTYYNQWRPIYSLEDKNILFCGPPKDLPAVDPRDITIDYVAAIPKFKDTDASWVADEELDLLTYATLWHTPMFLREDERFQMWQAAYQDTLIAANEKSAHEQTRGVSTIKPLPRQAGLISRRKT